MKILDFNIELYIFRRMHSKQSPEIWAAQSEEETVWQKYQQLSIISLFKANTLAQWKGYYNNEPGQLRQYLFKFIENKRSRQMSNNKLDKFPRQPHMRPLKTNRVSIQRRFNVKVLKIHLKIVLNFQASEITQSCYKIIIRQHFSNKHLRSFAILRIASRTTDIFQSGTQKFPKLLCFCRSRKVH